MTNTTIITLFNGIKVVTPDALNLITPYVLLEQEDWFEDEIKFVRKLLKPGQQIIDIGANFGVYTLSMAKVVGPTGRVWAFEPATSTANVLAQSIAENDFHWIELERSALSSECGTANLSLNENSELNSLVHGMTGSNTTEQVELLTLDECQKRLDWPAIDFIKIDAEGEEVKILRGGSQFFEVHSPLVQYELKVDADHLNMALVQAFASMGYASYRLVPGLGVLVPFSSEATPDGFLLNLFCCKPDRAKQLADRGMLVEASTYLAASEPARVKDLLATCKTQSRYGWQHTLAQLPYCSTLTDVWAQTVAKGESDDLLEALTLYALSQDLDAPAIDRVVALECSYQKLMNVAMRGLRLLSLARVAQDQGARSQAIGVLRMLTENIHQHNQADLSEPFLAPSQRFENITPGEKTNEWVLAGALEELEKINHYSSYYSGFQAYLRLKKIKSLGLGSEEMNRRLGLVCKRLGMPTSL